MPNEEYRDRSALGVVLQEERLQRSPAIYMLACLVGSLLLDTFSTFGLLAIIGMVLLGYGATILVARGKTFLVLVSVAVAAAVGFFVGIATGVCTLALGLVIAYTVWKAPVSTKSNWLLVLTVVMALVMVAVDMLAAYLAGFTLAGQITATVTTVIQELTGSGTVPAETLTVLEEHLTTVASLWPAVYLIQGLVYAVLVREAVVLALRRHKPEAVANGFTRIDFSIHTLWVLIAALVCIIVSGFDIENSRVIAVAGYNLGVCAAAIYMIQGCAVCGYYMLEKRWHLVIRIVIYLLLVQFELMFLLPTLIGLVDLWGNIRKLNREKDVQEKQS